MSNIHNLYHIVLISKSSECEYRIHMFSDKKVAPREVITYASKITETFPDLTQYLSGELKYIGYEILPISSERYFRKDGEQYYAVIVIKDNKIVKSVSNVPGELIDEIRSYRKRTITLKIQAGIDATYMTDLEFAKLKLVDAIRTYEGKTYVATYREQGYDDTISPKPVIYFRGYLDVEHDLSKILDLRRSFEDSSKRIKIDELYIKEGFDYLTNYILDERYIFEDGEEIIEVLEEINPRENIKLRIEYPTREFVGTDVPDELLEKIRRTSDEKREIYVYTYRPQYRPEEQHIVFTGYFGSDDVNEIKEKIREIIQENYEKVFMENMKSTLIEIIRLATQKH